MQLESGAFDFYLLGEEKINYVHAVCTMNRQQHQILHVISTWTFSKEGVKIHLVKFRK
ncbi:MAG: hypothetical protein RLZZ91_659 [Bacteroidota bacterium]|jgi:hypothetical protein